MKNKLFKKVLDETPQEVEIFVRLYADLVLKISEVMKEKGLTQKKLAEQMHKEPSEISKWLNAEHNFTLRSLAKLQAELGETLIEVPLTKTAKVYLPYSTVRFSQYEEVHKTLPSKSKIIRLKPQHKNRNTFANVG